MTTDNSGATPSPKLCERCGDTGYRYDEEGLDAVNVRFCPCGSGRQRESECCDGRDDANACCSKLSWLAGRPEHGGAKEAT